MVDKEGDGLTCLQMQNCVKCNKTRTDWCNSSGPPYPQLKGPLKLGIVWCGYGVRQGGSRKKVPGARPVHT